MGPAENITDGHRSVILLCDGEEARRDEVERALVLAGVHVVVARTLDSLPDPASIAAVVMALPGIVEGAALAGLKIVGYGAALSNLDLERRCHFLLAGIERVLDSDASDFLPQLLAATRSAFERHETRQEEERRIACALAETGVVATSATMRATLRRLVRLAGLSRLPVLLTGETGTGKELAARLLHARDPQRSTGPFVPVNCAALAKSLAESELFGHRRGAFSGAAHDRLGLARAAHGGVLFLDEVGELAPELQGKLLRVIQEGTVLPVGEERECRIDTRVIAATHRDLSSLVARGDFREDLFYRLSVVTVRLPPLRERKEDIPALARHLADKHSGLQGGSRHRLAPEFLDALTCMELPGNVRQLENIVRAALSSADHDGTIGLAQLPREALLEIAGSRTSVGSSRQSVVLGERDVSPTASRPDLNLSRALDQCERTLLEAALTESDGCQSKAAQLLGVTARTVHTKVRKHGIDPRGLARAPRPAC